MHHIDVVAIAIHVEGNNMQIENETLAMACAKWHLASDAYALELVALEKGTNGASDELTRLGRDLVACKAAVDAFKA